jgi:hypothetical protein
MRVYSVAQATIVAQNTFTDHIHPADKELKPFLNLSITGLADSTVTLMRTFDGGNTWATVESYTFAVDGASVQKVIEGAHEGSEAYRLGVLTGEFGTDTPLCRLSH